MNNVSTILAQRESILNRMRVLHASIAEELAELSKERAIETDNLDAAIEEEIYSSGEKVYTDASLLRTIHTAVYDNGNGLTRSSRALRDVFPSNVAVSAAHGGWTVATNTVDGSKPERIVHMGSISVSDSDTDEKIEATAKFLKQVLDAVEACYPTSEYGAFRVRVTRESSESDSFIALSKVGDLWILGSVWGDVQHIKLMSSESLSEILKELRDTNWL